MTVSNISDLSVDSDLKANLEGGMSGYAQTDDIVAFSMVQGGRRNFTTPMALGLIPDQLPVPDPTEISSENRELKVSHAKEFGQYVLDHPTGWACPPLMVRIPNDAIDWTKSKVVIDLGPTKVWVLALKRTYRHLKKILDGQHRIYGIADMRNTLDEQLQNAVNLKAQAIRDSDEHAIQLWGARVAELEEKRAWMDNEAVMVQLVVEDDPSASRQIFVDIADNALGINKSVRVGFDQRDPANRATRILVDSKPHPLLKDRVNDQKSRVSGKSPDLLARNHVADIIKIVALGINGRMTRQRQLELSEVDLAAGGQDFFDLLVTSFTPLQDVADGKMLPADLRKTSLLGSVTMLRILAGIYYEALKNFDDATIEAFFVKLGPHMAAPIDGTTQSGQLWIEAGKETEAFVDGSVAPGARAQQVIQLVDTITSWIDNPPNDL